MIEIYLPRLCWARLNRETEFSALGVTFEEVVHGSGHRYRGLLELSQAMSLQAIAARIAGRDARNATFPYVPNERAAFILLAARLAAAIAVWARPHTNGRS